MIMNRTTSATTSNVGNSSSMSSFMSGLLRERAVKFSLPNANWSISIVDDNARPKHIDKRQLEMLQQKAPSNKDLRWGSDSAADSKPIQGSSSDNSIVERRGLTRPSNMRRTGSSSMMRHSTPSVGNSNRFESPRAQALPPAPGLRRAAASDTMLLKMPVRTKSPGKISARPTLGAVSQANAQWGQPQKPKIDLLAGLSKMPKFDPTLEDITSVTMESDWSGSQRSNASSLSRSSKSTTSLHSTLSSSLNSSCSGYAAFSGISQKTKKSKKKKSSALGGRSKNCSSDSLKKRASMLGLDLR